MDFSRRDHAKTAQLQREGNKPGGWERSTCIHVSCFHLSQWSRLEKHRLPPMTTRCLQGVIKKFDYETSCHAPSSVLVLVLWEFALVNDEDTGIKNTFSEPIGDGNQARSSSMLKDKIRTHFKWVQISGFFRKAVALSNHLTGLSQLSSHKPVS